MRAMRWMWLAWLLCVLSGAAQAQYGQGQVTRYDATDFPGNDIDGMSGPARSYEECAQRCAGDGRCGAFTFNLNNGMCIPKSSAGSSERNNRAVSGVVNRSGPGYGPGPGFGGGNVRGVMRHDATDFPGNDIPDMVGGARSYEDCAQRCLGDGRCGAFTFNLNNGNCIPKSSVGSQERNNGAVSGVLGRGAGSGGGYRPGRPELPVTRYDATDFPGNDLGDMVGGARSYEDCAQRCLSDGRCGAFTFNLNNGNCIPKSTAGNSQRNNGAVSGTVNNQGGYRPGPPDAPVMRYDATDFPGNDIDDMIGTARSYDDCARRCVGDNRCTAFTFNLNNGNCIPKAAAGDAQRNNGAVSGIVSRRR